VSWNSVALGTLCNIYTGKKDVNEGNESGIYPFFTCATKHTFSDTFSFDCEAILVAGNGAVGQTNYFKGKFEAYQRTYVLCNFKGIIPHYLLYFLNGNLMYDLSFNVLGNTIPYIKKGMLTDFQIPLPPLPIQQKIVVKLDKIFAEIDKAAVVAEANAKNSEKLFKSFLHNVFKKIDNHNKPIKLSEIIKLEYGKGLKESDRDLNGIYGVYGANGINVYAILQNPFNAKYTTISNAFTYSDSAEGSGYLEGMLANTTSYTGFTFNTVSGATLTGGTIRIYGLKAL
jgi:restriction endonuclease S subunit